MESFDLLERAKFRRAMASLALRRVGSTKREMTPEELRATMGQVKNLQSQFGAPHTSDGKPAGKAGRTMAFIENWLKHKGDHGLPPVGKDFDNFVKVYMDRGNYIWGHSEAVDDIARDIHYNYGFDPRDIQLVEAKKPEPADAGAASMVSMPNIVSELKPFTKTAEAYEPPKKEDSTKLDPVPVVTRVDYEEDLEKAKDKSQFPSQPFWNKRNVGVNDLLKDLSSSDYEKDVPEDDVKRAFDKKEPYPKEAKASIKEFVKKK